MALLVEEQLGSVGLWQKPCPLTWGSGGSRRQEGLDGLVSVLRLFSEPSSPQRSSQPAL